MDKFSYRGSTFLIIMLIIGVLAACLPSRAEAAGRIVVKGTYVNVRSSANINSKLIGKIYKGETFSVVKENWGWYHIQLKNGQKGWVAGWLVKPATPASGPGDNQDKKHNQAKVDQTKLKPTVEPMVYKQPVKTSLVTVKGAYVNLRSGPATSYTVAGKVLKGQTAQVLKGIKDWYQVRLADGRTGWVAGWLVAQQVQQGSNQNSQNKGSGQINENTQVQENGQDKASSQNKETGQTKENGQSKESKQNKGNGQTKESEQTKGNSQNKENDLNQTNLQENGIGNEAVAAQLPRPARISSPTVNLRSGPSSDTTVITKLAQGTRVEALRQEGDWLEVKLSDGTMGWVAGWLVKFVEKTNRIDLRVETGEINKVTIIGSEPLMYEAAEKQEPNRLVIKIIDAELSGTAQEIPVGRQGLIKLTSGLAEGDTASVQINLELETGFKWIASQGESDRVMVLVPGEGQAGSVQDNGQAGNGQTGSNQGEANLTVRTVVIDPGHGGIDPGAIGPNKLQEKDVVFDISKRVGQKLEAAGYRVVYTRTDDTKISLTRRPAIATENNADIFVSIHANSSESSLTNGTSTYYYAPAGIPQLAAQEAERRRLAQTVQNRMIAAVGRKDLGIMQANFAVLRGTTMPSILVETAYLSYREEEALLSREDIRERFAQAIFEGIKQYFEESTPSQ